MVDWKSGHWPQVGVGVLIARDGKVLFGQRKGSHGPGTWCPPGGKLEKGETIEACGIRETREESGLTVANVRPAPVFTNEIFEDEGKHFVTVYLLADYAGGEAKVMEPDKLISWQWASWDDLPQPLFMTIEHLLEQGYRPPGV